MTDNLAGIQRHSTDAFWKPYIMITFDNTAGDVPHRLLIDAGKEAGKPHDEFLYYSRCDKNTQHAVLVPEDDCDWWLEQCINHDVCIGQLFLVGAPGADRACTRIMYDMRKVCLGAIKSFGKQDGTPFRHAVVFKSLTTGIYYVPVMTGWVAPDAAGRSTVAVNKKSDGARYHDYRNIA